MKHVTINSIDELLKIVNSYPNNFAFRGQANFNWGLQSTLERMVPQHDKRKGFEEYSLEQFRSKFKIYSRDMEVPEKKLSWLSLMQHHGVPTRLLDFTTSPYIALYFAIESLIPIPGESLALYAIDYTELVERSCEYVVARDLSFETYSGSKNFYKKCEEAFEKILDNRSHDVLWFVDPVQLNNRLEQQAGTFLISGSFDKSIEELLNLEIYSEVHMDKICISHEFYKNIYALLRKVNIGPKNIYGDLHGLAMDIQLGMKVYNL
ncbi:FRG domain-containing protein [Rhodoferax bucti]|uniref:FRG domain-containing protein n=1 Tax=Rhodoferax bucti TaxID=2576305 RepID=UPI0011082D7E|nr:FRG domain-containing protein [Rhodoferax bucti]